MSYGFKFVLMVGGPVDGYEVVGPFNSSMQAFNYGEEVYPPGEWWVRVLQAPLEREEA